MGISYDLEALTARQMENEERIIDRGVKQYREALSKAENKGTLADSMPGRWLSASFLEPIAVRIRGFIHEAMTTGPGRDRMGANMLTQMEPDVYAYVALRTVFNSILGADGECERSAVQTRIARELREEMQHSYMQEERSKTYDYWMREARRAPNPRTKRRCLVRLRKNFPGLPSFRDNDEKLALAAASAFLVQAVVDETGVATIETYCQKSGGRLKTKHFLVLNPKFVEKMERMNARAESLWPKFEPMVCPPKPWTGAFKGAFVGKLGERTKLIRTDSRSYLEDVHNSIQQGEMSKVLKALNAIQATPWRINRRIYDVMQQAFDGEGSSFGLPSREKLRTPKAPDDMKTNPAAARKYVGSLKALQRREAQRASKHRAVHNMLRTAQACLDEEAIWFGHNLDWRGRVYPMSSYLSPQGDERSRALLEFANGLPLETDEAVEWLAIHGAGCFGVDKVSFADRVAWVREHEDNIRQTVAEPLDFPWWAKADKPWMFLSWCIDWVGYLENGKGHISHLPVAMDGSCNGLQNFAAMLKHEETARAVNLAPSEIPCDIYQRVADKVRPVVAELAVSDPRSSDEIITVAEARTKLEYADSDRVERAKKAIKKQVKKGTLSEDEGKKASRAIKLTISKAERMKTADLWNVVSARWIKGNIDRKLVKRPVMTYPYAVTLFGIRDQLIETLLDMHGENKASFPPAHVGKIAGMLRGIVLEAIKETVVAAAEAMRWLQEVASVVAEAGLPVTWTSPVGMLVMQNYWESMKVKVSVSIGGMRYEPIAYADQEGVVKKTKQASGVAPNFVHSCDASHLMLTTLACTEDGLTDFHMIHDSYGTHAGNAGKLARVLREQFIFMYNRGNILVAFQKQLADQLQGHPELLAQISTPPEQGDFNITQVLDSRYFFA